MNTTASIDDVYRIIYNDHHDPFQVLGQHILNVKGKNSVVIRAFLPDADTLSAIEDSSAPDGEPTVSGREFPMKKVHPEGFFEVVLPERSEIFPYQLKKTTPDGKIEVFRDSYSFMPTVTDFDIYLFNKGDNHRVYEKLGAHYAHVNGIGGVQFSVWAPSARSVSVIGDFNNWDRRFHAMRVLGSSGIWEIFVPGLPEGSLYKFHVKTQQGFVLDKTDPYGTEMEVRPRTAARVNFLQGYSWDDQQWMERRATEDLLAKSIAVYEVHLGSWKRNPDGSWIGYRDAAKQIVEYVKNLGYTHIELMPVMEHPFDGSWGYQVTGYFAVSSRFGPPQDFMYFVDYCHQNGIGVLLDWVPAHFPKDMHALALFDGTHVYEHADPRKGEHMDWGTYIFNYGRNEVKNFLISNALFWLEKYHIDGLRIDAVASMLYLDYSRKEGEWIPNQYGGRENLEAVEFVKHLNSVVHQYYPGVLTIAEESTSWPGVTHALSDNGLGFDLKWNMGWMHDMLEYFSKDPVYRPHHHRNLTFALLYAFSERFMLPLSHDEVVHGKRALLDKMPGDIWQKFANLRSLYALMFAFPGKKLLFMGCEFAQWKEWNFEESVDWALLDFDYHKGVSRLVQDLNRLCATEPSLHEIDFSFQGFEWIDFADEANSIISFERKATNADDAVTAVFNFTPVPRHGYRIGARLPGTYRELVNTDALIYGGSNLGNAGEVSTEPIPAHGRDQSLSLTVPPLGAVYLKRL
ncbi:MAG: 1,4-alpha-glucan branching protein GlgB [Ignavibacteriae bacterium]|nr:1,4-alpha-glucan branching protein GlgB [Ignavibacteriota bacterium]